MSFPNDIRLKLQEKFSEALVAVTPILIIVLILSFTVAQIPTGTMLCFLIGAVLLIVGMMFFTLGADLAMVPIGEYVGSCITRSKKIRIIVPVAFLIGFIITIAEPDLQVLAE